MTDEELVKQALTELGDVVRCRCHEAYKGRGLHDPDCQCDSAEALATVTKHIEALTEQLEAARADAKEAEAYAEELEAMNKNQEAMIRQADRRGDALEAKLAQAVEALRYYAGRTTYRLCDDCPVQVHSSADLSGPARTTLAEIEGEKK